MNEMNPHHWRALAASGLLTLALVVFGVWYATHAGLPLFRLEQKNPEVTTAPTEQELTDIMLWYLKTLPVYDQQRQPAIVYQRTEPGENGASLKTFSVEEAEQAVEIVLEVKGWNILGHQVTVGTLDGELIVTSPEPGQIAASGIPLVIKGRAPRVAEVSLSVWADPQGSPALFEERVPVTNGEFFYALPLSKFTAREFSLVVAAGESSLTIPVSLDRYGQ